MIHSEEGAAPPDAAEPAGATDPEAVDGAVIDIQRSRLARPSAIELPGIDELAFFSVAERVFPSFPRSSRYEGVELLDTGATSSVWRAFDRQLQLDVAIKVFDRSNRTLDEVLDEARASCAVRSDYVVRVIDVVGDEPPFIVMELVGELGPDGYRIGSSAFVERPRSLQEAVRWVREAAAGVHAAHQRYVSHRDLKPRNVLVTPVSRRAMVADFGLGIARKRRDPASGDRCVVGTPTHMAPEQARGVPVALDMRSVEDRRRLVAIDVFGLGALAFDLITGNPPYAPDDHRDAHERALSCDRDKLHGARTAWKRRMPRRLARIIEKAMTDDPDARYPTAHALEIELSAWAGNLPTSIDGSSQLTRLWLWFWRGPARSMVIVLLVATALAILVLRREVRRSVAELVESRNDIAKQEHQLRLELEQLRHEQRRLDAEIAKSNDERAAANAERNLAISNRDAADREWHDAEARARREAHKVEAERAARLAAEAAADAWQDRTAAATAAMQRAVRDEKAAKAETTAARAEAAAAKAEAAAAKAEAAAAKAEATAAKAEAAAARAEAREKLQRLETSQPPQQPMPRDPPQQQPAGPPPSGLHDAEKAVLHPRPSDPRPSKP